MMWNKLLLTEFVIYLCRLVGLMLLVFEFYRLFFPQTFLFFCIVCWCALNLAVWKGSLMTKSAHLEKNAFQSPYHCYSASQPTDAVCKRTIPDLLQHISVILRDAVGLGSQTSQAATAPSLPCTDESWLGSSELLFQSSLLHGRLCSRGSVMRK